MYIETREGLQQVPRVYGSLAGTLGAPSFGPEVEAFLHQVRKQPKAYKKLLLNATLSPAPFETRAFTKQTIVFDKKAKSLIETVLLDGKAEEFLEELRRISNVSFRQQIEAELKLRSEMFRIAATILVKDPARHEPLVVEALLADDFRALRRPGLSFASQNLPPRLVGRLADSEVAGGHLTYLGGLLQRRGEILQDRDAAFKKRVEQERKKRAAAKTKMP